LDVPPNGFPRAVPIAKPSTKPVSVEYNVWAMWHQDRKLDPERHRNFGRARQNKVRDVQ